MDTENETQLRQQILRLSIQNAMLTQQFQKYAIQISETVNALSASIPKPSEIQAMVHEANEPERKQTQAIRDSAITHLAAINKKLEEMTNGNN